MFASGMKTLRSRVGASALVWIAALAASACDETAPPLAPSPAGQENAAIRTDSQLFTQVTATEPFQGFVAFPNLSTAANGTLPASSAHRPNVRVSLNQKALGALQDGRLPPGATFPDGSVIFKEVIEGSGSVSLYAVMLKDRTNPNAGEGWLWAELRPSGGAEYSVANRGAACTPCHSLERGRANDHVRIFERQ